MAGDHVSKELRAVEDEIDSYYRTNPLAHLPFAEAAWYFLAFCEEIHVRDILREPEQPMHEQVATADNVIVHAKRPMLWLRTTCSPGGSIPPPLDDKLYEAAWNLSELGMEYLAFESAFTYASSGLVSLELEGDRIKTSGPMRNDSRFDAYDRLRGTHPTPIEVEDTQFLTDILPSVQVQGNSFKYDLNPKIVKAALEALAPVIADRFVLPGEWILPRFTLEQFGKVARVLWVLAFLHFQARLAAIFQGCEALAMARALLIVDRNDLVRMARRYSGVELTAVSAILEDLTYGSRQTSPDPALQPIIPLRSSFVAIAPNLLMHSSLERNLAVLVNRLSEEKRAYAALNKEREVVSRKKLEVGTITLDLRFWHGQVPDWGRASDIDLAIVSDSQRQCLILELKSFIDPAEPREIQDRSEEIKRGIQQIVTRREMAAVKPEPLHKVLNVDIGYRITWAVASETSIGAAYVQSSDVPVVNTSHLLEKLKQTRDLAACCQWLEKREYLPVSGVHYEEVESEATIGKYTVEWYSIRLLVDTFL